MASKSNAGRAVFRTVFRSWALELRVRGVRGVAIAVFNCSVCPHRRECMSSDKQYNHIYTVLYLVRRVVLVPSVDTHGGAREVIVSSSIYDKGVSCSTYVRGSFQMLNREMSSERRVLSTAGCHPLPFHGPCAPLYSRPCRPVILLFRRDTALVEAPPEHIMPHTDVCCLILNI